MIRNKVIYNLVTGVVVAAFKIECKIKKKGKKEVVIEPKTSAIPIGHKSAIISDEHYVFFLDKTQSGQKLRFENGELKPIEKNTKREKLLAQFGNISAELKALKSSFESALIKGKPTNEISKKYEVVANKLKEVALQMEKFKEKH